MTVVYTGRTLLSWADTGTKFTVEEGFTAFWKQKGVDMQRVRVSTGFKTDLASIPRIFQPLIPKLGHHIRAAIVHDYIYEGNILGMTRLEADLMFLDGMKALKVAAWRRYAMFAAVRAGGKGHWAKQKQGAET